MKSVTGPSLKGCSVVLTQLSQEEIDHYFNHKRSICTMTPADWWDYKIPICPCQKIPVITLEEDDCSEPYSDKSISTQCTCTPRKYQARQVAQHQDEYLEPNNFHYRETHFLSTSVGSPVKYSRVSPQSMSMRNEDSFISGSSASQAFNNKGGLDVISRNGLHDSELSLSFKLKRALHRRPLAVVAPTLSHRAAINVVTLDSYASVKVNYHRSILDAIKWYTKHDSVADSVNNTFKKNLIPGVDRSQENIKPLSKITITDVEDYLKKSKSDPNRDYCFVRSSDCKTKLVTRRGERHYIDREPCPSCFQGNDRFCVYEFVRRAKLAGVTLLKNQRILRIMYYKIMKFVNEKS